MPVKLRHEGDIPALFLEGVVTADETDEVVNSIKANPGIILDLSKCEHLHTAVLQAIIILQPCVAALPADPFWGYCLGGENSSAMTNNEKEGKT